MKIFTHMIPSTFLSPKLSEFDTFSVKIHEISKIIMFKSCWVEKHYI